MSPPLAGGFLTTGPPRKCSFSFYESSSLLTQYHLLQCFFLSFFFFNVDYYYFLEFVTILLWFCFGFLAWRLPDQGSNLHCLHWKSKSGEGNGTPLQYSCLENPMDGGAWWAAVHGVAKSWTRLRDFTFTFHFHGLEKEMATHSSVLAWRMPGMGEPGGLLSMGSH